MTLSEMSFVELEKLLFRCDVPMPSRPSKPVLKNVSDIKAVKAHADALEAFEVDMSNYNTDMQKHNERNQAIFNVWMEKLYDEYGLEEFNKEQMDIIYDAAYDRGHSSGHSEVRSYFGDMIDLFSRFQNAGK